MFRLVSASGVEVRRSNSFDSLMDFVGAFSARIQVFTSQGWEDA